MILDARRAGILLPISSLPNDYGIGTLGKEAYDYVDFLVKSKQTYWQILPIGPTSYGDSPYQSFSVFAGNPYFIDFDILASKGYLVKSDYEHLATEELSIDYGKLYNTRFIVLRKAFEHFKVEDMAEFVKENESWIHDYAMFMSIKNHFNGKCFLEWPDEYKLRDAKTLEAYVKENIDDINFWKFLQYEFMEEWINLRQYANNKGIKIIGDMPIYTSLDSSDVWSNKECFLLDENMKPTLVAGCPPDAFAVDGQLWGNPIYDYKYMKKDNYRWWVARTKQSAKFFDVLRIDHFRGFEAYYAIKASETTARNGKWMKGPNVALFKEIEKEVKGLDIIAENLGFLTKEVDKMLDKLGYPGMKIVTFGFDPKGDSDSAPHNLLPNMIAYPGTHDNMPIRGWYESLTDEERAYVHEYLHFDNPYEVGNEVIRACLAAPSLLTVIAMQDYLQLGNEARINTPSTSVGNWTYRIHKGDMNDDLARYIANLMVTYRRCEIKK